MIPRQEILKQINRYYDLVESIDKQRGVLYVN